MSTYSSNITNGQEQSFLPGTNNKNPMTEAARDGAANAMEFQLWVSQQSSSLSKLKIFHTMAKSVNDQQ